MEWNYQDLSCLYLKIIDCFLKDWLAHPLSQKSFPDPQPFYYRSHLLSIDPGTIPIIHYTLY